MPKKSTKVTEVKPLTADELYAMYVEKANKALAMYLDGEGLERIALALGYSPRSRSSVIKLINFASAVKAIGDRKILGTRVENKGTAKCRYCGASHKDIRAYVVKLKGGRKLLAKRCAVCGHITMIGEARDD